MILNINDERLSFIIEHYRDADNNKFCAFEALVILNCQLMNFTDIEITKALEAFHLNMKAGKTFVESISNATEFVLNGMDIADSTSKRLLLSVSEHQELFNIHNN